ncbi:AI-2E family transporter [Pendulispora albinea]|uniref:AI-2E family transporter n=1 Tax=Pendulispora albinea TaxID=2741071 RepID=A0ABZ2MBA6_9BACT
MTDPSGGRQPERSTRIELHVPVSTIARLLVTALLVWAFLKLWPELLFLFLSLLLAVALEPMVAWCERRRVPRGVAILTLALLLLGSVATVAAFAMPPLVRQFLSLVEQFPSFRERVLAHLHADTPWRGVIEQLFALPSAPDIAPRLHQTLMVGQTTLGAIATAFCVVITTLYLLLDGKRLYVWLLAYVPRAHRARVAETIPEVSRVVTAYVRGQLMTSLLFTVFTGVVLQICHVPAVLPLAVLAGMCDVIPVVGIILATLPAALLALTVSPITAGIVVATYVVYHQIEAYMIVPRIYGSTLRLSTLAVLLALLVGGTLQGILGVVLILPIVAAYPVVERIWLKDLLGPDVIRDHEALARAAESGNDAAIEAVLQGVKHPEEDIVSPEAPREERGGKPGSP